MTVKQWLMRGWTIDREINSLLRAKREAFERLTSITAKLEGVTVSGTKDPHRYEMYASFESEIDQKIDELYAVKTEILNAISHLPRSNERAVLTERYVNLHTLERTAVELNYSYQQVCRIQGKAFDSLREILKDEIK